MNLFEIIGMLTLYFHSKLNHTVINGFQGNALYRYYLFCSYYTWISIAVYLIKNQIMKALIVLYLQYVLHFFSRFNHTRYILPKCLAFVNNVSGAALVATYYMKDIPVHESTPPDRPSISGSGQTVIPNLDYSTQSPLTNGLIEATNACWQASVAGPWAAAQFGYSDPNKLLLSTKEIEQINEDHNSWFKWKGILPDAEPSKLLPGRKDTIPSPAYIDTVWLASGSSARETLLDAITNPALKESGDRRTFATACCGQSSATHHLLTTLIMLPASILFFVFVLCVGIPVFIAQFVLMILLLILPLALLLGVAGDRGVNLLRTYISTLLGCLATKIIYGFYLGMILFLAVALSRLPGIDDRPGLLAFMAAIIFFIGIRYHKDFYHQIIGLLSFAPETTSEKASNWVGSTAKTLAYAYLFKTVRGGKSNPTDDDNPPGGGRGGGEPDPPHGDNNNNSGNNNGGGGEPDPPPGNDTDNSSSEPPPSGGNPEPSQYDDYDFL